VGRGAAGGASGGHQRDPADHQLHQGLAPGYDYLLERKLSSIWREVKDSALAGGL
jgi:hypothetical protein